MRPDELAIGDEVKIYEKGTWKKDRIQGYFRTCTGRIVDIRPAYVLVDTGNYRTRFDIIEFRTRRYRIFKASGEEVIFAPVPDVIAIEKAERRKHVQEYYESPLGRKEKEKYERQKAKNEEKRAVTWMKVKALLDQGMTPGEIADKLGTKLQTVTSLIGRFEKTTKELEGTDMAHLTKDVVKKMADEGMSVEEIAEQFMPSYPKMKKSMMIAKVTMLLNGKKSGRPAKEKTDETVHEDLFREQEETSIKEIGEQAREDIAKVAVESEEKIAANSDKSLTEPNYYESIINVRRAIKELIAQFKSAVDECVKNSEFHKAIDDVPKTAPDYINHPPHYTTGKIEVIDYIQDKLGPDLFEGFCIGNVIKYLSRYRFKGGVDDLKKAAWYLNRIIKTLETA